MQAHLEQFSAEVKAEIGEAHRQLLIAEQALNEKKNEFIKMVEEKVKALGHVASEVILDITQLTLSRKEEK